MITAAVSFHVEFGAGSGFNQRTESSIREELPGTTQNTQHKINANFVPLVWFTFPN